ncbi:MAG: hypothetical protein ACRDLB_04265 [Actinomycetota bacterium]
MGSQSVTHGKEAMDYQAPKVIERISIDGLLGCEELPFLCPPDGGTGSDIRGV